MIYQSLYCAKVSTLSGRQVRVNCLYLIQASIDRNLVASSKFALSKSLAIGIFALGGVSDL